MFELARIDLGKDEAEQDQRLREYFLKTANYLNAQSGQKTIVIGRKGSGKSAIFKLLQDELKEGGAIVIPITPDQYSWSALKDYEEKGILPEQAHTNAWKLTLLCSVIWKFHDYSLIREHSELLKYYQYMKDAYVVSQNNWLLNIIDRIKQILKGINTPFGGVSFGETSTIATPLRVTEEIKSLLKTEWPTGRRVRILIDRLDDSWDASKQSENLIIGLLKAANELNAVFLGKMIITVFLRSDIYDNLFFDDQDKLRQNEETLYWNNEDLKSVVCERVRTSLNIHDMNDNQIWQTLFSEKVYRSKASPEKYILDRTFKRPRDIISFVRFALEVAIRSNHNLIEPRDTRLAEEEKYSQSKYKDLIIEYQKLFPFIKDLLDSLSGTLHKHSQDELLKRCELFLKERQIAMLPTQLLRNLFIWGVVGVKRQGRAGVKQRGGAHFFYYYDDPSINPLHYADYYIHPSLRYYLNISEKRERVKQPVSTPLLPEAGSKIAPEGAHAPGGDLARD